MFSLLMPQIRIKSEEKILREAMNSIENIIEVKQKQPDKYFCENIFLRCAFNAVVGRSTSNCQISTISLPAIFQPSSLAVALW